jgi:ketosteroid isomerase-like protein
MRLVGLLPGGAAVIAGILLLGAARSHSAPADDVAIVAALDTKYQAAVEANDWATMDAILADDFVLVTGRGTVYTKADLLKEARNKTIIYEFQKDSSQTVRLWGNTAVVTALLKEKGTISGKPFEKRLWFSDTYVRTTAGWRYVFGQASLPLPD